MNDDRIHELYEGERPLTELDARAEATELEAELRVSRCRLQDAERAGLEREHDHAATAAELERVRASSAALQARADDLERRLASAEHARAREHARAELAAREVERERQRTWAVAEQLAEATRDPAQATSARSPHDDPPQTAKQAVRRASDLSRAGDHDGALRGLQRACERDPASVDAWLGIARCERNLGRLPQALAAAHRALDLRPGLAKSRWLALQLTASLDRTADFRELAAALEPLSKRAPGDLAMLGRLALRAAAYDLALHAGELLCEADPRGEDGLALTAIALWEQGDEHGCEARLDAALDAGHPEAVRAALRCDEHVDRFDRVEDLLSRLDPPDVTLTTRICKGLVQRGEARRAMALLDRVPPLGAIDGSARAVHGAADAALRLSDGRWAVKRPRRPIVPRPGRALHLVSRSLPHHMSGGTYRTHHIVNSQREAGLDPHVVTELGFPWSAGRLDARGCELLDGTPHYRLADLEPAAAERHQRLRRSVDELLPLVRELRPSVLHPASDYMNASAALELRGVVDVPVVYEVRGFPEERRLRRAGSRATQDRGVGRRELEIDCMLRADRVVTLAEVMKQHIVARGVPAQKIVVIPNAVDPRKLQPRARDEALARRLGVDRGVVLGYVSTFHEYEGIRFIVEAVAELCHRGRDVRALLVGDGNERHRLELQADELGIADRVIFTGRVPHGEVLGYYGLIDLFVVARRAEATSELVTPLKPFEAMAAGCNVIVSDVAALREIVSDGETGRTFTPERARDLADVAEELIDDPAERRRLATTAREWVVGERTWARNARRYRELYDELGAL